VTRRDGTLPIDVREQDALEKRTPIDAKNIAAREASNALHGTFRLSYEGLCKPFMSPPWNGPNK